MPQREIQKSLGRRINIVRKEKGLTSEGLSELCYINGTYLRQIEAGSKVPSLPVFVSICRALEVSPSYLLAGLVGQNGPQDELTRLLQDATPGQLRLIAGMARIVLDQP